MISESEALQRVLAAVSPLELQTMPLAQALDAFAGCDMIATVPIPGFDQSSMDGYALRAADARPGAGWRQPVDWPAVFPFIHCSGVTCRCGAV